MRTGSKFLFVICLIGGVCLFFVVWQVKSVVDARAWFRYASKYDRAMIKMWASGGGLQDAGKAFKMEQEYLRAKQPTETEIISFLRSPDRGFQRVGLVAMSIKPIETEQVVDILFEFLREPDRVFIWYALESLAKFSKFPESKKADLGEQLLEIIKSRKVSELSLREFSLLAKFPSKEAALFLAEQMMREGKDKHIQLFRVFAFRALKEMGDSYYDAAAEYVNKHGSSEIKKELLGQENFWETRDVPTGEGVKEGF